MCDAEFFFYAHKHGLDNVKVKLSDINLHEKENISYLNMTLSCLQKF